MSSRAMFRSRRARARASTSLFAALSLCAASAAAEPEQPTRDTFAYGFTLEPSDASGVYRTTLPADVYRRTMRSDLGDLCVFNGQGEVVPHALRPAPALAPEGHGARELPWFVLGGPAPQPASPLEIEVDATRAGAIVRVLGRPVAPDQDPPAYLLDASAVDAPITDLELALKEGATEVWARLTVEASADLEHWQDVGSGVIAVLVREGQRLESRRITLSGASLRYLRINATAGHMPAITGVKAGFAPGPGHVPLTTAVVSANTLPDGGLLFDSGAHFPVERVGLRLRERSTLLRAVVSAGEQRNGSFGELFAGLFYRLDGVALVSPPAPLATITRDRYYKLSVDRRSGGLGAALPDLELYYRSDELLWVARGSGPFTLAYGSASAQGRAIPAVDIAQPSDALAIASLGARRELGGPARLRPPPPPPLPWKVVALWVTLIFAALIVIVLSIRLARRET